MDFDAYGFFATLADPTRLRIVALLQQEGELCVCELVDALATRQPKVSKHLAVLRQNAVIKGRRQGQWIHYRLDPNLPRWAANVIRELVDGFGSHPDFVADRERLEESDRQLRCDGDGKPDS